MIKTITEVYRRKTFEERYAYLKLGGIVGESTFGYDRYLNQTLYKSGLWRASRDLVIIRDEGCDLGDPDREIFGRIIVHHLNPITIEQIEQNDPFLFDPEFLICTSDNTHNAIHYGDESLLVQLPIERRPNDTCPWAR